MTAKVVPLRGELPPDPDRARQDVVAFLREILELAEAGRIDGIAVAMGTVGDDIAYRWMYGSASWRLAAAVGRMQFRMLAEVDEADAG
jgi:hypothetical protein